jgi:hypothetical protein
MKTKNIRERAMLENTNVVINGSFIEYETQYWEEPFLMRAKTRCPSFENKTKQIYGSPRGNKA